MPQTATIMQLNVNRLHLSSYLLTNRDVYRMILTNIRISLLQFCFYITEITIVDNVVTSYLFSIFIL